MATQNVTSSTFEQSVLKSDKFVLVDFWAPWCRPCQMMAPVLEELSDDQDLSTNLSIAKVDTEVPENQMLAYTFQIQSIPNLKLFQNGKVVAEYIGYRSKEQLKAEIGSTIKSLSN